MNGVNFNVATQNVNFRRLKDESTEKSTEQINFGCKNIKHKEFIDAANKQATELLNKNRPVAEQKEVALRESVSLFFKSFGILFKNACKNIKKS